MPNVLQALIEINRDIIRNFEFDYILFDALFLVFYVALLILCKRYVPLQVGILCGILIYIIDGIIWTAVGVREYGISAPWIKFPVDFMMDVSYGIVAFSWVWIAFERRSNGDVAFWTGLLFMGWLALPFASRWIHLFDDPIMTVRHMDRQVWLQIVVVIVGYAALLALKYDLGTILYVFWVGCMLAFMMEFSLFISKIRPTNIQVLVYETLILTNQGIPYVYIIKDKILPLVDRRIASRKAAEMRR